MGEVGAEPPQDPSLKGGGVFCVNGRVDSRSSYLTVLDVPMRNRSTGGGRPSKGPRDQFNVRPTEAVGIRVREEADELNVPYGEVCARILAEHYGLPAFNDIEPRPSRNERVRANRARAKLAGQEPLRMTG